MSLQYLEDASPEQILTLWKTLHQRQWSKYAADPRNEKLLCEGATKYRLSLTAFDRSFSEIESSLHRSDGKTAEDDLREAAERQRAQEAEEQATVVLQPGIHEYAGGLSLAELQREYFNNKNFRLQYNVLIRDFGYKRPPEPRTR